MVRLGILSASPHRGNCHYLTQTVLKPALAASGCQVDSQSLCSYQAEPCVGCGACERTGICALALRERHQQECDAEIGAHARRGDKPGFLALLRWLDGLDALIVVAPLYFAGPSAQFKASLDRMQFLWSRRYMLHAHPTLPVEERRPLGIVSVGGGGDPFGWEPLVTCVRSSLRMMDYECAAHEELIGYRTGTSAAPSDEELEPRAASLAQRIAQEALQRGPFVRRGAIDAFHVR